MSIFGAVTVLGAHTLSSGGNWLKRLGGEGVLGPDDCA
jgi:hypothetical protein